MKDKLNKLDAILHELQMDEYLNEDSLPKLGEARSLVNELLKTCSIPDVVRKSALCKHDKDPITDKEGFVVCPDCGEWGENC